MSTITVSSSARAQFEAGEESTEAPWPYARPPDGTPRASGTRNARSRIIGGIQAYRAALAEQRRLRRARSELESLDDRMLKDIGVVRCEIGRVVRYGRDVQFPESMKREA